MKIEEACDFCRQAFTENPRSCMYTSGCKSCTARVMAAVGCHIESDQTRHLTTHYLELLKTMFGDGGELLGHYAVKDWALRMREHNVNLTTA